MILQSLVNYYEAMLEQGKIAPLGWGSVNVSFALQIDAEGNLLQVIDLKTEQERGKKTVLISQKMEVPAPVKRSSGIAANFLCDNAAYFLGIDSKGKPERSKQCFEACKILHQQLLEHLDNPNANAVRGFFEKWKPEQALAHPLLQENLEEILGGVNLVFYTPEGYPQNDPLIRQEWENYYSTEDAEAEGFCLVTGKTGPIENVHPPIKNVTGAQSSGAALVSFNAPAFCSYGKEQNLNAPTGKYAAFAYTTALNYLLADRQHKLKIGDTTVVFWAKSGEAAYQDAFFGFFDDYYGEADLEGMLKNLCNGRSIDFEESKLDPEMDFYILGLAPNAARLSVRFFLQNSFGFFLSNVKKHYERLEIVRPNYDKVEMLSLNNLLLQTVNQKSQDKSPVPNVAGETLRAILMDTCYPATLLNGVTLRIRAEQKITRGRAAIIKAYYLKKPHKDIPQKEVLTVSLNPNSTNVPYTLGRLFSVLEDIQAHANPGINSTIRDKYFNSASATPGHVFPTLINLAQKHLKKISNERLCVYYNKQLTELMAVLGESYPVHLSLPEQGAFQLGYYHQTQARYNKENKEEEKNV